MNNHLSWSASKSLLNCPYSNLAWESSLLNGEFEGDAHFFFYRNTPSIILGRFQVPWREINFLELNKINEARIKNKIVVVRRRSGGGTVYHDLGNWNFCFVRKERELHRNENLELIQSVMSSYGVNLLKNDRYDLSVNNDENGKTFKVSGCAFKQKKETALHHGTLLVDAKLEDLKGVLGKPASWEFEGKGIKSNPSAVCNLRPYSQELKFDDFFARMCQKLQCEESELCLEKIDKSEVNTLRQWSWLWGETPEFSIKNSNFSLCAKKGQLTRLVAHSAVGDSSEHIAIEHDLKLMDPDSWKKIKEATPHLGDLLAPFFT